MKRKHKGDGSIEKYKARFVVCGNEDDPVDVDNFAPIVDFTLLKLFLSIVTQRNRVVHKLDFINAFSHGLIDRVVYVEPPKQLEKSLNQLHKVYLLNKRLYDLREAPRTWYDLLVSELSAMWFKLITSAPCVFYKGKVYILCYVDDLLIVSPTREEVESVKQTLSENFLIKDLGQASHFLGVDLTIKPGRGILMRQGKVLNSLLKSTGMESCRTTSTPMDHTIGMSATCCTRADEDSNYRSIMGSILYLAVKTRPYICVATGILCRHVEAPSMKQKIGAERVLKYLSSTKLLGLKLQAGSNDQLSAYMDSSWGGEPGLARGSRSGIVIKYGNAPIYAASILQKCVTLSSTEAEYVALSEAIKTITWLRRVLNKIGIPQAPSVVYQEKNW